MKLHFDPTVPVAVYFLIFRAGDHSGLAAEYSWLGMMPGRAIRGLPRCSEKGIAIALMKVPLVL